MAVAQPAEADAGTADLAAINPADAAVFLCATLPAVIWAVVWGGPAAAVAAFYVFIVILLTCTALYCKLCWEHAPKWRKCTPVQQPAFDSEPTSSTWSSESNEADDSLAPTAATPASPLPWLLFMMPKTTSNTIYSQSVKPCHADPLGLEGPEPSADRRGGSRVTAPSARRHDDQMACRKMTQVSSPAEGCREEHWHRKASCAIHHSNAAATAAGVAAAGPHRRARPTAASSGRQLHLEDLLDPFILHHISERPHSSPTARVTTGSSNSEWAERAVASHAHLRFAAPQEAYASPTKHAGRHSPLAPSSPSGTTAAHGSSAAAGLRPACASPLLLPPAWVMNVGTAVGSKSCSRPGLPKRHASHSRINQDIGRQHEQPATLAARARPPPASSSFNAGPVSRARTSPARGTSASGPGAEVAESGGGSRRMAGTSARRSFEAGRHEGAAVPQWARRAGAGDALAAGTWGSLSRVPIKELAQDEL